MKTHRIGIGKSLRFSVFSRDNFTCRYCGRQSDIVPLHVDHVIPVCQGGTNDAENLITACSDCNLGKSGRTISQSAPTEADRLRLSQERNEQIDSAKAAAAAGKARAEIRQVVCNYYCNARGVHEMPKRELSTIVSYVNQHGADIVFSWIDSAVEHVDQLRGHSEFGRYISGCRRRWMEENADA